jgi:hypothetical protein
VSAPQTPPGAPKRAPELRLPYPLLEYLFQLPGDYAKLVLRLLQRAQWTAGMTREGLLLDAGEVLISLRSEDIWGAITLDRDVSENGRVSLLRRVLRRLADDGYVALRPAHQRDTHPGARRDTPATVVRFLKFRDNLWPANASATRGTTQVATRRIGTIPAVDPADPFPASRIVPSARPSAGEGPCNLWGEIAEELRRTVRPELYERWFAPLKASRIGDELLLLAPNRFHQAFVEDNYRGLLEQRLTAADNAATGEQLRVRVVTALVA